MAVDAVVFDLDETLILEKASVEAAFVAVEAPVCARYGIDPLALKESVIRRAREIWHTAPLREFCVAVGISSWEGLAGPPYGSDPRYGALESWAHNYRLESWRRALADYGIEDLDSARDLAERFPVERKKYRTPYPDAKPMLEKICTHKRLGLLTNGAPSIQREKLSGAGLDGYFDPIVVSGEIGVGKPDLRVFETLLDVMRISAERVAIVGDNLATDIRGGLNAGLKTVWVNRHGAEVDGDIRPHAEIPSLESLPSLLDAL